MPGEAGRKLVRRQRSRHQPSGRKAGVLYAADRSQEVELTRLKRRTHDCERLPICRIWKASNLGVPELPAEDAIGGNRVAHGERELAERLSRSAQFISDCSPRRPAHLASDDGPYAADRKI